MDRGRTTRRAAWFVLLAVASFCVLRLSRTIVPIDDHPAAVVATTAAAAHEKEPEPALLRAQGTREPAPAPSASGGASVDATRSIGGLVSDRADSPVAGARCELRPGVPVGGFVERLPLALVPVTDAVLTEVDGRFRLDAGPGHWRLRVESPGYAPFERDHLLAGDELRVRLDHEVRVVFVVLDEAGQPREGVEIVVRPAGTRAPDESRCRLRTDARGRAETTELGPGSWGLV
ncbi:MAG: hypothetical protein L0206_19465, partial [Actinobacteria bacterium]|nr:hypothetical protein [Actinomycetota bacterium]